jgi:hypothetical protein
MKLSITTVTGLLVFGLASAANLMAVTGCTNAYLQGSYGGQISGAVSGVAPASPSGGSVVTSTLALSRLVFDGLGSVVGTAIANGATAASQIAGSYTVNNDCTVSMALTDSIAGQQAFSGVLVAGGNRVYLARMETGVVLSGSLERARNSCTVADFNGSYGFRRAGSVYGAAGSTPATLPSTGCVGMIIVDGNGAFTLFETSAGTGSANWKVSTGTYTVADDCSVALTFDSSGANGSPAIRGTLTDNSRSLFSIETQSGVPMTGSFSSQ